MSFTIRDNSISLRIDGIRWPDHVLTFPRIVVAHCPFFWGIKWFVWVKFVNKQHEALTVCTMMWRVFQQPLRSGLHRARTRVIIFTLEPSARCVVVRVASAKRWCTNPACIGSCLPRITLMAALIRPRGEIGMEIFATNLKQVGVIGNQIGNDASAPQGNSDGLFPDFDRAPRLP